MSEKIRNLIAGNKISEAIDLIIIENNSSDESILLKAKFAKLEEENNLGTISNANYQVEYSKIIKGLLSIISPQRNIQKVITTTDFYSQLDNKSKHLFINIFLRSNTLGNNDMKETFVNSLPLEIKSRISRVNVPLIDVKNIVETCISFRNGWETFNELFLLFEGDAKAIYDLEIFMKKHQ